MSRKTVFITGASGFVASHAAMVFMQRGWAVKALLRRPDKPGRLPAGVQVVKGDVLSPAKWSEELAGCDAVVHAAGVIKARTLKDYRLVNVEGTRRLAEACQANCPGAMFVLVSSQAAAGPARTGRPVEERDRPQPCSWYGMSKLEGEAALAQGFHGRWTVVRPCVVYGPGDSGLFEIFRVAEKGWSPIIAGGKRRIQLISGADLAEVIFAAANRPDLAGRHGFAASETVTMGDLVRAVGQMRRPPARAIPVPGLVLKLAGTIESIRESVTGVSRPFNRDKAVEMLQRDWVCESTPFLQDLQVKPSKPWQEGLQETCDWYLQVGWLGKGFLGPQVKS